MDAALESSDASKALDLNHIRFQLIRLEDTITFHLIERAQFPLNKSLYEPGAIPIPNSSLSLFDWMLSEQERLHSFVRRYESPDEYPFFPEVLQKPILQALDYPRVLHRNDVNVNKTLKQAYVESILPSICKKNQPAERAEHQENFGSAATCDVMLIQALSCRIHYGKYVAESKFQSETERFVTLIKNKDVQGIDEAITNAAVEQKVLERLKLKAQTYGTDPSLGTTAPIKVDADAASQMYKDFVIPLTKKVEVDYLLQRLRGTQWEH